MLLFPHLLMLCFVSGVWAQAEKEPVQKAVVSDSKLRLLVFVMFSLVEFCPSWGPDCVGSGLDLRAEVLRSSVLFLVVCSSLLYNSLLGQDSAEDAGGWCPVSQTLLGYTTRKTNTRCKQRHFRVQQSRFGHRQRTSLLFLLR